MGTIMAIIIQTDGSANVVDLDDDYKAIQAVVGGCFDLVASASGNTSFWVNDEGKLIGLPVNDVATKMLWDLNPAFVGQDYLVGTVLVTGGADENGDTLPVGIEGLQAAATWRH